MNELINATSGKPSIFRSLKETDKTLCLEQRVSEKPSDTQSINSAVVCSLFEVDETKKDKRDENNSWTFIKQTKILVWIERVFLISICVSVAAGFTVPIIIYAGDADRGSRNAQLSIELDSCNNSNTTVQV